VNPTPPDNREHDTPMTGTYIAVVIVEATIIALLFLLGTVYS
jgi:hypothetical protein